MAETSRSVVDLGIRRIDQDLTGALIWKEEPQEIVEKAPDLRYFKVEAIR